MFIICNTYEKLHNLNFNPNTCHHTTSTNNSSTHHFNSNFPPARPKCSCVSVQLRFSILPANPIDRSFLYLSMCKRETASALSYLEKDAARSADSVLLRACACYTHIHVIYAILTQFPRLYTYVATRPHSRVCSTSIHCVLSSVAAQ